MKAATRVYNDLLRQDDISIHAAREGGDFVNHYAKQGYSISIHAAREGGDDDIGATMADNSVFQSTPPVKAATCHFFVPPLRQLFQSTPPVKAATRA